MAAAAAASEEKSVQIEIQGNDDVDQGREKDEKTIPVISSSDAVDQGKEKEGKGVQIENQVIACNTLDRWNEHYTNGLESKKPVVIYFTASWCGPCRVIGPTFSDIAKKIPGAIFLKVDVDELEAVAQEYDVQAMPTFVFLKEGKEVAERVVGAKKDELHSAITKHCSS
ncbi:unnamed protein product [Cuscuta campestris]|uniref:Thioredoxin domain-containing protein n=1 Tax=Cuscuta campestris TaxID=132261 RepID=A0A484KTN7_9ASTE|nr:unnamed protein product [Cuscuta campestris]